MEPLISIIIPVYKTEQYLRRCIASITAQDYSNLEIILVDDELALEDSRIRVVHKENGGLSSARNAGLEAMTGQYVCFVDSDDYVEKDYVSTLYRLLSQHNADLAKIDYAEVTTGDHREPPVTFRETVFTNEAVERAYLDLKVDSACVFLYKRELIGQTRFPLGKTSEDIPFNFEIFQKAHVFVYAPVRKYYYYYNPQSISNGPLSIRMINYLTFRQEIFIHYQQKNDPYLCKKSEALYARAAMGLMARMALYGIAPDLDEKEYAHMLRTCFMPHRKVYFTDPHIPLSRKMLAILVFWFYPVAKCMGRFMK